MRRKLASSLLCMMMLCSVCTPAYADESTATTETPVSTTETVATTTTEKKEPTKKESVHEENKKDTKVKKNKKSKKTKKKGDTKDTKKKDEDSKKDKKTSNEDGETSFVQPAPEKKVSYLLKKTHVQLEKIYRENLKSKNEIKKLNAAKKIYKKNIQIIHRFETKWKYGQLTGIRGTTEQSQDVLNISADQEVKQLSLELKDTNIGTAATNYHYGLQDQKNILLMMDSFDTIDLQSLLSQKEESYKKEIEAIDLKIKKLKTSVKVADHSMRIIETKTSIVFDPKNLLTKSNLTKDKAKKILKGTALEDCSDYFIECEEKYGVNAIGIMAIAVHESAWGTSRRAQEDHNLTGYGVYSDSAKGINAPSKEENLLMTAKLLKEQYLDSSGSYHEGTSLMSINEHYCTSGDWAINVTNHAYTLMSRL